LRHRAPALLAIGALGALALLAILSALLMLEPGHLVNFDAVASGLIASYRTPWVLEAFLWLTTLGTGAALLGMTITATGFLWADRRAGFIIPLWVAFAGAQASVWTTKYAIGRLRPTFLEGVATAASPSFPSAHATGTAATLGFIAYAVARDLPGNWRYRFRIAIWTAVLVAFIDLSRVFLGVHFMTDVLGGTLLGGAWLLIGIALAERRRETTEDARRE
jgi:membrane-associated phospholipid phosphatase